MARTPGAATLRRRQENTPTLANSTSPTTHQTGSQKPEATKKKPAVEHKVAAGEGKRQPLSSNRSVAAAKGSGSPATPQNTSGPDNTNGCLLAAALPPAGPDEAAAIAENGVTSQAQPSTPSPTEKVLSEGVEFAAVSTAEPTSRCAYRHAGSNTFGVSKRIR